MKRFLSIILCAVLAFTPLLPAAAENREVGASAKIVNMGNKSSSLPIYRDTELDDALNYPGTYLEFKTGGDYPFFPSSSDGQNFAEAGNSGVDSSVSYITAHYYTGDNLNVEFRFSMFFSTESEHDFLVFSINGEEVFRRSGEITEDASGWNSYRTTLNKNTYYTFTWSYVKDGSGAGGNDCVRISNVLVSRHVSNSVQRAANAPGCPLEFTPSEYLNWEPVSGPDGRLCISPVCLHDWHSSSTVHGFAQLQPGDTVSFDYYCDFSESAEQAGGMLLTFRVDTSKVLRVSSDTQGWQSFSYTLDRDETQTSLYWIYSKPTGADTDDSLIFVDNISITYADPDNLDCRLNAEDSHLHFTSEGEYPFTGFYNGHPLSNQFAASGNNGVDNSVSVLHCDAELMLGDMLVFDYYISSEPNDIFSLMVDGEELYWDSGLQGEEYYTIGVAAQESGIFSIDWVFSKDGDVSLGCDCVRISNVYVLHQFDNALNALGNSIMFYTTEEYPFFTRELEDGRVVAESGNRLIDSSYSALAAIIDMRAGETLSFDYWLDCYENQDFFLFGVNGALYHSDTGEMLGWQSLTFTAPEDGEYLFEWIYEKDEMFSSNYDCLRIDNVAYSGEAQHLTGDVNCDGRIDTTDALLVLRYALGADVQFDVSAADVNGDGLVNTSDALMILRAALGL